MKKKECRLEQPLQLQINAQSVMTDFCYDYSEALLKKLNELREERRIFRDNKEAEYCEERYRDSGANVTAGLTPIASSVVDALCKQIAGFKVDSCRSRQDQVDAGIAVAEEFLAIFERKPEYSGGPENPAGD